MDKSLEKLRPPEGAAGSRAGNAKGFVGRGNLVGAGGLGDCQVISAADKCVIAPLFGKPGAKMWQDCVFYEIGVIRVNIVWNPLHSNGLPRLTPDRQSCDILMV